MVLCDPVCDVPSLLSAFLSVLFIQYLCVWLCYTSDKLCVLTGVAMFSSSSTPSYEICCGLIATNSVFVGYRKFILACNVFFCKTLLVVNKARALWFMNAFFRLT